MSEITLTDENFEKEISNSPKPVLVDFWAEWCAPCLTLGQILEKIAEEYKEKIILAKVNLDTAPLTAQKYKIDRIPFVIFFNKGKPLSGFIGLRPEPIIKEWLEEILLIKEYEEYAQKNGFKLNPDREVVNRLIKGLLENEKKYGKRYCPCRRIIGNPEEDKEKICPCKFMQEEIEKDGHCLCQLFVRA